MQPIKFRVILKQIVYSLYLFQRRKITTFLCERSIKRKIKRDFPTSKPPKDKKYLKRSKQFLKTNFSGYTNTNWHYYYSSHNQIKKAEYIPDSIFFSKIFPVLNYTEFTSAYMDKTAFDLIFEESVMPRTIFKLMNGDFYDYENNKVHKSEAIAKLAQSDEMVVLKPAVNSSGGKGVIIDKAKNLVAMLENKSIHKRSYILQEKIEQHPEMAKFHPASVNTLRVTTARKGSNIEVLSYFMRMGVNNSTIDNGSSGGIMVGANNGKLNDFGIDLQFNRYYQHPDSGIKFKDFEIPNYKEALNFCIRNHKKIMRFTIISWDIVIGKHGEIIFIEYNFRQPDISVHQYFDGPLFGEHTDYFIQRYKEECQKNEYFI